MPRGRKPKDSGLTTVANEDGSFNCSACTFKSNNLKTATSHINKTHYGQARLNNNNPLTDGERVAGFINAQKALKVLTCSLCKKGFRSGLGYKFHNEICGKDENELYRECEICGKKLKLNSLTSHIKNCHMTTNKETVNVSEMMEQLIVKKKTLSVTVSGKRRKRSSAIKALENFKELSDDEQETSAGPSTEKRQKTSSDSENEDDLFEVSDEEVECQVKSEDSESEDGSGDDENQENEDPDNSSEDGEAESGDEVDESIAICAKDIDDLLLLLKQYIRRKVIKEVENRTINEEITELEQENDLVRLPYKCYTEGCQKFFNYRIDLENHYNKCSVVGFLFTCVAEESCTYRTKQLNMDLFEHFYARHRDLLPAENQITLWMNSLEVPVRKRQTKPRTQQVKSRKTLSKSESKSRAGAENYNYSEELNWEKQFIYTKEWISYLRLNEGPSTYRCLAPLKRHWKMLLGSPLLSQSSIIPRYKLTKSMEQSSDNDFKFVAPLHSARNEDTFTFNVGQYVCSAAWAPIPLPTPPTENAEEEVKPSTRFTDFLKWSQKTGKEQKRQYLAVATASYFDGLMNVRPLEGQGTLAPECSLQLWDMGPLASGASHSSEKSKEGTLEWTPQMALNASHSWGDIAEMSWCPCASTYQVPDEGALATSSGRMRRLGLLALACEDGKVRIVSMPHPRQLSRSYDVNVRWELEPVLVLSGRYQTATSPVTSVSWAAQWPQEQLLAGFGDGTIALWNMDSLSKCKESMTANEDEPCCKEHEAQLKKAFLPKKIFGSGRRCPVLSIKWLNPMTFFTSQSDSCWFWNLRFNRPFSEHPRNIVQKVETHPLWYNTLIFFDTSINKSNSMLMMKSFCNDELFEGDTAVTSGSVEALKLHAIASFGKMRCNDLSLSPWQYLLAYCTENGELYTTSLLPKPFLFPKRIVSHLLYKIRLGDLISFEGLDAQLEAEDISKKVIDLDGEEVPTKKPSSKAVKDRKLTALVSKAEKKRNQLINGVVDLAESYDDFFLKYYLIFDDAKKLSFGSGRALDKKKVASTNAISSNYLTKNDLARLYAITNCLWNPNLPAYSWLFTATKSGICRLSSYPLVNPQNNLNC